MSEETPKPAKPDNTSPHPSQPRPAQKKRRWWLITTITVVILVIGVFWVGVIAGRKDRPHRRRLFQFQQ